MTDLKAEYEELRVSVERVRTLLENLVVRGLRACGADELAQLKSQVDYLDSTGAAHVSAVLAELHAQIERDDRAAARTLLKAQTAVRMLERLLTLRIVNSRYEFALAATESAARESVDDEDVADEDEGD